MSDIETDHARAQVGVGLGSGHPLRIHVVGVGGVGMSAVATVLAEMGHAVSGSDIKASPVLERLRTIGVKVALGHDPANVADADVVVISSAITVSNVEVVEAGRRGITVASRADVLSWIVAAKRSVAIAGTHGKTTTTSMLAQILVRAGMDPSFIVGGELNEIGGSAAWDEGEWLVVEADESDGTFLQLKPTVAVVTNVEPDHLDHFGSLERLREDFRRYVTEASSAVVWADDPFLGSLAGEEGVITVGRDGRWDYVVSDLRRGRDGSAFALSRRGEALGEFHLAVPGAHNIANAALAGAAGLEVGAEPGAVRAALGAFGGVARRFQFKGCPGGVQIVDDYAHLPGEVRAVLAAAAEGGWERVVAVFQPHRYSRTELLWQEFAGSFGSADVVVVADVYPAGEAPRPGITGRLVADAIREAEPNKEVIYIPGRAELAHALGAILLPGDVCMLLGAGDVGAVAGELEERLA